MGLFDIFFGKSKSENFSPEKFEKFLRDGKKTEAIKLVKDTLNTDLKEARDFTDYFDAGRYSWDLARQRYPSITEKLLKDSDEVIKEAGTAENNITGNNTAENNVIEEVLTESVSDFGFVLRTEENNVIEEVEKLLKKNQKIEAIKMIRAVSGTGLKESKDFADYFLETGFSLELTGRKFPYIMKKLTSGSEETGDFMDTDEEKPDYAKEIAELTRRGQKIQAIKRAREVTGAGLKDAKEMVEYFAETGFLWEKVREKFAFLLEGIRKDQDFTETAREASIVWTRLAPGEQEKLSYEDRAKIEELTRRGNKIGAIKELRGKTGLGLKESKEFVEELERGG